MKLSHVMATALVGVGLVFGQAATGTGTATVPAKTEKPAVRQAPAAKAENSVAHGKIMSIDLVGNTLVVMGKTEHDTFAVNQETKVKIGGKDGTLSELKADMHVKVVYKAEAGKKVALEVMEKVQAAAPAKKEEAKKEPAK